MAIYFCFSDECGDYKPNMGKKKLRSHPFYVRSTLIIPGEEWIYINRDFLDIKKKYGIDEYLEIKWSYLWSLRSFQLNQKEIPNGHFLKPFENIPYKKLIQFVDESLSLLYKLSFAKIIVSYTENKNERKMGEKKFLGEHLQQHMQRVQMELQVDSNNLGIIFFDPINDNKNKFFRELYNGLYQNGDYIDKYKNIKDSLNFENSHHSIGIQLSDFISGIFSSLLKSEQSNKYEIGVHMYCEYIHPFLRSYYDGTIMGYGIREVPKNESLRKKTNNYINEKIIYNKVNYSKQRSRIYSGPTLASFYLVD